MHITTSSGITVHSAIRMPDIREEMDIYQHEAVGDDRVVTRVASEQDWKFVKNTILRNTGMNSIPVIKVEDVDYNRLGRLLLAHEFDDRELDRDYAKPTIEYVHSLWRRPVILKTSLNSKEVHMIMEEAGKFEVKEV